MSRKPDRQAAAPEAVQRIDLWLWQARFYKTRSLAARFCQAGAIGVGGATIRKPAQSVRVGDLVTLVRGRMRLSVAILGLAERRGPAAEARLLYRQIGPEEPIESRDAAWTSLLAEAAEDGTEH